tara:strand:+ start:3793 stop:4101 length:309 start_codon:yes stop_codon:yes gene_type:complete
MKNKSEKVVLFGRLGKNPELKYTKNSKAICKFSVAIEKNKQDVDWENVVVWEKQAEDCNLFLKKGAKVFVQGERQIKEYRNQEGDLKKYEEINAIHVGFLNL